MPAPDRPRVAGIAADALADLVVAALLDLLWQERIRDRRPRRADQIDGAASHQVGHPVGVGEPAHHHDRLLGRLAGTARPGHLVALVEEPRRARVEPSRPPHRADHHVPQVDHRVGRADELEPLLDRHPGQLQRVGGDPYRDRDIVADRLLDQLDRLEPEPRAVLEAAAVGVGAPVVHRRQELRGQVGVRPVHVDDVEPGAARPLRSRDPLPLRPPDVGELHRLWHHHAVQVAADLRRRQLRQPRLAALGVDAAVPQLDPGQRTVLVRPVGHHLKRPHVLVVPQPGRHVGRLVGLGADRAVLGADRGPAALRLHPAEGGLRPRLLDPEAGAVRYLVEPVAQRLRPDPDRLEQDVVALLAAHQSAASISALRRCMYSCSSSSTAGSMPGSS